MAFALLLRIHHRPEIHDDVQRRVHRAGLVAELPVGLWLAFKGANVPLQGD